MISRFNNSFSHFAANFCLITRKVDSPLSRLFVGGNKKHRTSKRSWHITTENILICPFLQSWKSISVIFVRIVNVSSVLRIIPMRNNLYVLQHLYFRRCFMSIKKRLIVIPFHKILQGWLIWQIGNKKQSQRPFKIRPYFIFLVKGVGIGILVQPIRH